MAGLIVCVFIVAMFGCLGFVAYLWHIEDLKRLEILKIQAEQQLKKIEQELEND